MQVVIQVHIQAHQQEMVVVIEKVVVMVHKVVDFLLFL